MITLKNVKVVNAEIARLKDFEWEQLSPEQREAMNHYYKVSVDDLQVSDQQGVAGEVPDIEYLINNG
jgi:hypothetical protein